MHDSANFNNATFHRSVSFYKTHFGGAVLFDGATFFSYASFKRATFLDSAHFHEVTGSKQADLQSIRAKPPTEKVYRLWPSWWQQEEGEDGWLTVRPTASTEGDEATCIEPNSPPDAPQESEE